MYKSLQSSTKRRRVHHRTLPTPVRAPAKKKRPVCDLCRRSFSRKTNLANHQRVHTGERKYQCTLCGQDFAWKTSLNYHAKNKHGDCKTKIIDGLPNLLVAIDNKPEAMCDAPSEAERRFNIPNATASYPLEGDQNVTYGSNFEDQIPCDSTSLDLLMGRNSDPILCDLEFCRPGSGLEGLAERYLEVFVRGEYDLAGNPHEDWEGLVVENPSAPTEEEEDSVSRMVRDLEYETTSQEAMDMPVDIN